MLKQEENEQLTRTGRGTPMGETLRRYWLPALLSRELPGPDCAPVRVRLLGEDLVAFRDTTGRVGLVQEACAHRRASLFYGRNEECGLRCTYHGWKYDVSGQCVDMPNEPAESDFKQKVRITAYPCEEQGGLVWAYLGPAEKQPPLRGVEWMRARDDQRLISKTSQECNWLQALEGGLDTAHVPFLHRGLQASHPIGPNSLWVRDPHPKLEVVLTDYGFRYAGIRDVGEQGSYVRLYHFVMPFQQVRPFRGYVQGRPMIEGHLWVPIDDEHCWAYNWSYSRLGIEVTEEEEQIEAERMGRAPEDLLPGFRLKANRANDHLIDREVQRALTFTGIKGTNTQDVAIQESMGPILDRTQERLGATDVAIIALRRILQGAIEATQQGGDPVGFDGGSSDTVRPVEQVVPPGVNWYELVKEEATARW